MGGFIVLLLLWLVRHLSRRRRFPLVFEAKVEHVCDGDSIIVRGRFGRVKLRIAGMDAPETAQPRGRESERRLRAMLQGRSVKVRSVAADRYGRWVSTVTADDVDAGLVMVEEGEAWAYRTYLWALPKEARGRYLAAEARAMRAGRRELWAGASRGAVLLWRRRHRTISRRILDFFWGSDAPSGFAFWRQGGGKWGLAPTFCMQSVRRLFAAVQVICRR